MLVYKGVVLILDQLNCFISKITSLLFISPIQEKKKPFRKKAVAYFTSFFFPDSEHGVLLFGQLCGKSSLGL